MNGWRKCELLLLNTKCELSHCAGMWMVIVLLWSEEHHLRGSGQGGQVLGLWTRLCRRLNEVSLQTLYHSTSPSISHLSPSCWLLIHVESEPVGCTPVNLSHFLTTITSLSALLERMLSPAFNTYLRWMVVLVGLGLESPGWSVWTMTWKS